MAGSISLYIGAIKLVGEDEFSPDLREDSAKDKVKLILAD